MTWRTRILVIGAFATAIGAFAAYRMAAQRTACLAQGGSYELASLRCTAKPRPIILQRGILRS